MAAPVFGRPDRAERAELWVVAGGPAGAIALCRPAFEVLGQGVIEVGSEPDRANVMKLAGNFLLGAADEARVPMPFGSVLHDRLLSAAARGWGSSDWAALGPRRGGRRG